MRRDKDMQAINGLLPRSKAVLVIPSLIKAGFILGAEGGSGVLLGHGTDGSWSAPAFFTMGSGSVGLQAGIQDAEVMFLMMTQKGLDQILKSEFKLGAEASVAAGPVGIGVAAATTLAVGADIYSYGARQGRVRRRLVRRQRDQPARFVERELLRQARDRARHRDQPQILQQLRQGAAGGAGAPGTGRLTPATRDFRNRRSPP
jgi:hypothetical protein